MRNFREYTIWKDSIALVKLIYQYTKLFPKEEMYGLSSQIQRASISISSNIAEGASRRSEKDFARFLEIALGSAFEVETQLIIAHELDFIDSDDFEIVRSNLEKIQKQINQLITKIRN